MPSQSSQLTKPTWQCAQRWWNAVEAAGLGYYGAATEQLSSVMEDCQKLPSPDGYLLASLCLSSQASWQRQMGNHAIAATLDDKAIELLARTSQRERLHGGRNGSLPSAFGPRRCYLRTCCR
ncbi:MAG: hypothetical protein U1U88_000704 [Lawsonella clevelandensis]